MVDIPRVQLPTGCTGLDFGNGQKYTAPDAGGMVEISEDASRQLNRSWYRQSGTMFAEQHFALATKDGRYCPPCKRWWQVWSVACPRCGEPTLATNDMEVDDDGVRAE